MATPIVQIESVSDFVDKVGRLEQRHVAQWFYRGHENSIFTLVPSLYRLDTSESFSTHEEIEQYMMESFKCEALPHLTSPPQDHMDWLAMAQHFKLPTRLLDWSMNALIGLYFAVEGSPEMDGDVWCLGIHSTNNCLPESTHFARRKTFRKMGMIYFPRHLASRITNQSGCFTVHDSPLTLNEQSNINSFFQFTRMRVAAPLKPAILNDLYMLGIHKGFVYPGLEGVAMRLRYEVAVKHYRHTNECETGTAAGGG